MINRQGFATLKSEVLLKFFYRNQVIHKKYLILFPERIRLVNLWIDGSGNTVDFGTQVLITGYRLGSI
jgi:hypothetical protein